MGMRKKAKLSLGMRLPPPTAQRMLVELQRQVLHDPEEDYRIETAFRDLLEYKGVLNYMIVTIVAPGRNVVAGVLANTETGLWLLDYPLLRPVLGGVWNEWVRFDIDRSSRDAFVTVGFTLYDGATPIGQRLQTGRALVDAELTGGHFYGFRIEPFLSFATESIQQFGVPSSAHRVP